MIKNIYYNKTLEVDTMLKLLKKTIGVCLFGLGLGILLVLLLPISGWLFIIGVALAALGIIWLAC